MLTADHIKVAIVMVSRASCSGEEATNVAATLQALHAEHERLTAKANEDTNGNDD